MNTAKSKKPGRWASAFAMVIVGMVVILIQSATINTVNDLSFDTTDTHQPDTILRVSVLTAGDAMAHLPQTQAAYSKEDGTYSYSEVLRWITPFVKTFDLSIINLETTLAGEPYKGYPQFSAPDSYAADLQTAGFNLFCVANNHSVDRYNSGVIRTIDVLNGLGIRHTGTFKDKNQRDSLYPLMLDINGIRIAVLNATYGTNGLNPKPPVTVNMINRAEIAEDIMKARNKGAEIVIAAIHWGDEYKRFPNAFQKSTAQFLADNGVDIIVGHHPHVLQPVEWIKGAAEDTTRDVLVIWSLGNFYSNQRDRYRDGGMFVNFELVKNINTGKITVEQPSWYPFWVWRSASPFRYSLLPVSMRDSLVQHYQLNNTEIAAFDRFRTDTEEHIGKNGIVRQVSNVVKILEIAD